ncbi:MAG TPA: ATP-binding cassette domain-containing protein, partial [Reyranella sp.]|nr:ATP-binding cassette domain-containing protein [Reyranella sp.]
TFRLERGARQALIGPNGAGKTTFVNLLTGVLAPSAGRVLLAGEDITRLRPEARVRRGLVRTFQINQLFGDLTPLETIALAIDERLGLGRDWRRRVGAVDAVSVEVEQVAERFGLLDVLDRRTDTLPYGKQRLLEIAAAFACAPQVLLLDEPAAGVPEGAARRIAGAPSTAVAPTMPAKTRRRGHAPMRSTMFPPDRRVCLRMSAVVPMLG